MKTLLRLCLVVAVVLFALPQNGFAWNWKQGSFSESNGFERRYVPPLTNPLFNETPYITTEASLWYFHQIIPEDSITTGGHINIGAAQARLALSDRLGLIATKDGYTDFHFGSTLNDTHGFANIAAGLKYAFLQDTEENYIVTGGIRYEAPIGDIETSGIELQGQGDGLVDLFVSAAKNWEKFGLEGNVGTNLALDGDENASIFHYSVHVDYAVTEKLYPIVEFNGISTFDDGNRLAWNLEGHDVLNLGSRGAGTTLTAAVGFRYMISENIQAGASWEEALTDREDLLESRATANVIFHF